MKTRYALLVIFIFAFSILLVKAQSPSKGVIKVGNAAPVISSVSVTSKNTGITSSPTHPTNDTEIVNFTVYWNDPNSDPVSVFVCKTNAATTAGCSSGTWTSSTSSSINPRILTYTTLTADPETNAAYVFTSDGVLVSEEATGDQTFYVNHRPFATSVATNPGSPTEASTLSCAYTFNDNDAGDTERSAGTVFQWYIKNEGAGAFTLIGGETTSTLANTNFDKLDVLNCRVRVMDNHGWPDDIYVNSSNAVTIGNSAPNTAPSALLVQDGAAPNFDTGLQAYDGTGGYDTHMRQPWIRWTRGTDIDAEDTIYTYFCLDTVLNGCNVFGLKTVNNNYNVTFGLLDYLGTSRTYHLKLTTNDGTANSSSNYLVFFNLTNDRPTTTLSITPKSTHDSTPLIDYADFTDPDTAGTIDNYPADTLTYFYISGTSGAGSNNLVNNVSSATSQHQYSSPIPWSTDGQASGWNNETVNVRVYAADGHNGGTSLNYDDTFVLYDYLPDVVSLQITDSLSLYTDMAVNPVTHSNSALAIRMRATDRDGDCAVGHVAFASLCDTTIGACTELNAQFRFLLNKVSLGPGDDCYYEILGNASTGTPEFWRDAGTFDLIGNITEQIAVGSGNERSSDAETVTTFTYNQLNAIYYPSILLLGGSTIVLGQFNTNVTPSVMENWGNIDLDLQWKVTDPISQNDYWNLSTEGSDDFMIDDDSDFADDNPPGLIFAVFLNYVDQFFDPATGLQNCNSNACNNPALNETFDTYYHIRPPIGLLPGLYNNTITITRTLHT